MASYNVWFNDEREWEVRDSDGDLVDTSEENVYFFHGGKQGHSYSIERTSPSAGYIYVSYNFLSLEDAYGLSYIAEDPDLSRRLLSTGWEEWNDGYIVRFNELNENTTDLGYFSSNVYAHIDGTEWAYFVKIVYESDCPDVSPYVLNAEQSFVHEDEDDSCWTRGTIDVGREDGRALLYQAANTTRTTKYENRIVYEGATIYAGYGMTDVSLFTADISVDLMSDSYTLSNVGLGDYKIAGQDVTFTSMDVNSYMLRFGVEFLMPDEASGLLIELGNNVQSGALVFNLDGSTEIVKDFTYKTDQTHMFSMLGVFMVTAKDMSVTYKAADDALRFQAAIDFQANAFVKYGVNSISANLAGSNYLQVASDGSVDMVGSVKVSGKVEIGKGFALTGLEFGVDTVNQTVLGTATLNTPFGLKLGAGTSTAVTLGFHYNPVELDDIAINVSNLNYAVPALPFLFIQELGGGLSNFAPSNTQEDQAQLQFGMTLGPEIKDSSFGRYDIDAEVTESYIQGSFTNTALTVAAKFDAFGHAIDLGSYSLVNYTGTARLDWSKGELSQTLVGSYLGGIATFSGAFKIGTDFTHDWKMSAQLNFIDIVPFFGGTTMVNGFMQKTYVNDDTQDNDYMAAVGQVNLFPALGEYFVTMGLKFTEGGGFSFIWGDEIPITSSWYISEGRSFVMLTSTWENASEDVEVFVTAPDGTIFHEADFAANGIHIVEDFTTSQARSVAVMNPMEGTWDVEVVDTTGLGEVTYFAVGETVVPEFTFDEVLLLDSETVEIDYSVSGIRDYHDATVRFYYDDDLTELDGLYFGGEALANGADDYTWDPSGVVPGDYYIYTVVEYGDGLIETFADDTLLTIGSEADIAADLSLSETDLVVGDTVTLTVTLTNTSSGTDSKDINLALGVPAGLDLMTGQSQQTVSDIDVSVATLAAGAIHTETLTFIVTEDLAPGDVATFSSFLTSGLYDPGLDNNSPAISVLVTEPVVEEPAPDLQLVTDFGDLENVAIGERITWTATLTNIGTEEAEGYTLDLYAPNLNNITVSAEYRDELDLDETENGLTVTEIANMEVGEERVFTFTGTVVVEGANFVSMKVTEELDADPDVANNEAYAALPALDDALPTADLFLDWASELPEDAGPGERLITLYIGGEGYDNGTQVSVQLDLPEGVEVTSATPEMGSYDEATGIWTVGNFLGFNHPALELVVSGSGAQDFSAEIIAADDPDPDSTPGDGTGDDFAALTVDFDDEDDLTGPYAPRHADLVATELQVIDYASGQPASDVTLSPGDTIRLSWLTGNIGGAEANRSYNAILLSDDMTFSLDDDTMLDSRSTGVLATGATEGEGTTLLLPDDLTTGTYYLAVMADYDADNEEGDETNNLSEIITLTIVGADPEPAADLQVTDISLGTTDLEPGETLDLSWELSNTGNADAPGTSYSVILSSDTDISPDDDIVLHTGNAAALASGGTADLDDMPALPDDLAAGTYYVAVLADSGDAVDEADETNNISTPVQFTVTAPVTYPDLAIAGVNIDDTGLETGGDAELSFTLANTGAAAAGASAYTVLLSTDAEFSTSDHTVLTSGTAAALAAGGTLPVTETFALPDDLTAGTYFVAVLADSGDAVEEADETNNLSTPMQITISEPDDPGSEVILGTPGDDDLSGTDEDDTISALAGDDTVSAGAGADDITLGAGRDVVEDLLEHLDGDVIRDFGTEDTLLIQGDPIAREAFELTATGTTYATLTIDADQDGTPEASVRLEGDFTGGDIAIIQTGEGTSVRYVEHLPELRQRQSLPDDRINGVALPEFLSGENASTLSVTIENGSRSLIRNSIGTYEIDGDGNLTNVTMLALDTRQASGSMELSVSDPDNDLGFFLVRNGGWKMRGIDAESDEFELVANGAGGYDLAVDGDVLNAQVFLSHDASANPDGMDHVVSGMADDGSGAMVLGFEDMLRSRWIADDDFQDVLLYLS